MARSGKKTRNICVGNTAYVWCASPDSGYINVYIWPAELPHKGLWGTFSYDETLTPFEVPGGGGTGYHLSKQLVITPRIIRRIIEYAIDQHGFDPAQKSRQLRLFNLAPHIDTSDAERGP